MDGAATMRAIRAALSKRPDPLLIDAASEAGGADVARKVSAATLEAMEEEAVQSARALTRGA